MAGSPLLVSFDFTNLIIQQLAVGSILVQNDMYSDWKEAVASDQDGIAAGSPPAFATTGGDDIGGGQSIAGYFFLRNDLGWRYRPFNSDGDSTMIGNIFPRDTTRGFILPTVGAFTHLVRIQVSPQALTVGFTDVQADVEFIRALVGGDAVVSLDDRTVTVYNNKVSPRQVVATYDISVDGRVRTRLT